MIKLFIFTAFVLSRQSLRDISSEEFNMRGKTLYSNALIKIACSSQSKEESLARLHKLFEGKDFTFKDSEVVFKSCFTQINYPLYKAFFLEVEIKGKECALHFN